MTKNAVITGASKGIGKAIVQKLIADSYNCILIARNEQELSSVVDQLKNNNVDVSYVVCDVTQPKQVNEALTKIKSKVNQIDVLVNCAGRSGGGVTKDLSIDLWLDVINTNLNSVFFVTNAALKNDLIRKGGSIINIASTGGKQGVIHGAPYSASKHGVVGFSKALGLELARNGSGITVNAVCPGFVETEMAEEVRGNYAKLWNTTSSEVKKRIEDRIPIGRYIAPFEVAAMVAFLSSDAARGITAQAINVCGGLGNY